MRIGMILSTPLPPREGIGFYAWNLASHLRDMGHEVQFITRGGQKRPKYEVLDGFRVHRPYFLPIYPFHVHFHNIFLKRLIRQLDEEIDLFHLHSPLIPDISTRHPMMLTFHSSVWNQIKEMNVHNLSQLTMKLQAPVSYWIENQLLRHASAVSVVSTETANVLKGYPGCSTDISVNWNGVNTQFFSPNGNQRQRYVLTTGRLSVGKGLEDLIDAAQIVNQRLGPTRFVIAGEGPIRALLERKIAAAGLEGNVELIGHVAERAQLSSLYQQAALFVSPSHAEGLPTVLLEAMACACPVVATCVGGSQEVITSGEDGILVPPKNPAHLADVICDMLQDPSKREKLGQAARQTAEKKFSWKVISQIYLQQYEKLLRGT
jgi:glycosyltransferase involved in cell wall biosynthesis